MCIFRPIVPKGMSANKLLDSISNVLSVMHLAFNLRIHAKLILIIPKEYFITEILQPSPKHCSLFEDLRINRQEIKK